MKIPKTLTFQKNTGEILLPIIPMQNVLMEKSGKCPTKMMQSGSGA